MSNRQDKYQSKSQSPSFRTILGISILWLSLSFLSDGMTAIVLPYDLERLGGDYKATLLGLLTFGGILLAMLIQPFAGRFSDRTRDRWGRRGVIGIGLGLTLPCLALYAQGSLAAVAGGFVLALAAASVSQAGLQGYVPDIIPAGKRGFASGVKGFMDLAGAAAAFVVTGQAVRSGGSSRAALVVATILVAGYLLTVAVVREPPAPVLAAAGGRARHPFHIDLRHHRAFAWTVVARFLFLAGTYAIGRFFEFFVGDRLGLARDRAAEQAGTLLGTLALITLLSSLVAGWAADRWGRKRLMYSGALLSAAGIVALIMAHSSWQILAFGSFMAAGNACFAAANWAMTADLVPPPEAARYLALANFGTMGAAACAGLFGPVIDQANRREPGSGYTLLFMGAALASMASIWAVRKIGEHSLEPGKRVESGA